MPYTGLDQVCGFCYICVIGHGKKETCARGRAQGVGCINSDTHEGLWFKAWHGECIMYRHHGHITKGDRMKNAKTCEWCKKRKATYTAYREVGFGVQVKVADICAACNAWQKRGINMRRCIDCQQFTSEPSCPCAKDNFYQVRNNWQGPGYRLYYGGERYVSQVDGEINGRVFDTIQSAKAYCLKRFGEIAKRTH